MTVTIRAMHIKIYLCISVIIQYKAYYIGTAFTFLFLTSRLVGAKPDWSIIHAHKSLNKSIIFLTYSRYSHAGFVFFHKHSVTAFQSILPICSLCLQSPQQLTPTPSEVQ